MAKCWLLIEGHGTPQAPWLPRGMLFIWHTIHFFNDWSGVIAVATEMESEHLFTFV